MTRAEFEAFIRSEYNGLVRYGLTLCSGDISRAQTAVQEACLRLYRAQKKGKDIYKGYALKAVHSAIVDMYRKEKRSPQCDPFSVPGEIELPIEPEDIDSAMTRDVRAAVRKLPFALQRVVFLRYYVGLDNTLISKVLLISNAQVSRDIHRAHNVLRSKLQKWDPNTGGKS